MKKLFAALLVVSFFVTGAFAMTPEEELEAWKKEPAYGKVIKIGYNGGLCTGTLGITQVKGFYEAEGIKTELVRYQGDTVALGDALGTGKIDIAGGHIATLLVPAANGVQMKFTTGMHTGCKSLCVLNDSPYKTTHDLKGKTIAITTSIGGSDQNITMRFLLRDGMDPVNDVKYKSTDSGAAVLAMQNGEIAAALLSDQFIQKFLEDGTLRIIRSITFDDDFKDETCCIYAISKNIVENSPITARKLTQAHENARKWIMANREETIKLMLEHKWASGEFDKVLAFYNTLDYSVTDKTTEETLIKVIDDYKACGILNKDFDTMETLHRVWDGVLMDKDDEKAKEDEAWKKEPAYGRVIKIGYNGGLCLGTFGIAQMKGFYADEGLKTEIVRFQGLQGDSVGTGKIDVTGDHIATMLIPAINGVKMKFTTGIHSGCKALCVLNDSPYKTTKDLIGKTFAIPDGIGASDQNITMRFLANDGLDPLKDVKYKVAEPGAAVLAMKAGEIQCAILGDQFIQPFLKDGTLRVIRSLTHDDDFKIEACCIHAVNLDFYEQNPITVKKLTRAHEKASEWIMNNREEAIKLLQANNWASGDLELVSGIFKYFDYSITDEATEETLRKIIKDYKSFGLLPKDLDNEEALKRVWDPVLSH